MQSIGAPRRWTTNTPKVLDRTLVTVAKNPGWNSGERSQNRTWALTQTASYGMGRACHSHKNTRTKGPSPPSISRPTWPSSPTPLPPVPDSPLFPKLPCGRPHNPQWRRLPWRRARALAPRQGHTPQKAQCMASVSSAQPSTNAMHIFAKVQKKCSALFRKVQKKCKTSARCLLCKCVKTLTKCNKCTWTSNWCNKSAKTVQ